jgi:hypothetical protein
MQIIQSEVGQGTGDVTFEMNASILMVKGNGGAAVISINGRNLYTIAVTSTSEYITLPVDIGTEAGFKVVSGSVDYIALG